MTRKEGTSANAGRNRPARVYSARGVRGRRWTRTALKKVPKGAPKKRASGTVWKIVERVGAKSSGVVGRDGNKRVSTCATVMARGSAGRDAEASDFLLERSFEL